MSMRASPGLGRLITFEGGEGAGKSTQIARLAERLARAGVETVTTREPGGTPRAEMLRALLLSGAAASLGPLGEAALFTAARIDHVDRLIAPALQRGDFVLCDRFIDSTRAYQGAMGRVAPGRIAFFEKVALAGVFPALTFILDLPPQEGLARAARRRGGEGADRFEKEDLAFHEGLRAAFLGIARDEPARCVVVDSTRPRNEVAEAVWCEVERRLLAPKEREA
jgi:dTMP kinase